LGSISTEPALGDFGISAFAVWIRPNKAYQDSINGQIIQTRAKPNLLTAGGMYTANNSWGVFGASVGVIKKWRSNYRLMGGLFDMNLKFYRDSDAAGEESFLFNIEMIPVTGQLIKQLGTSNWFSGVNYSWQKFTLARSNPAFFRPGEEVAYVSRPGIVLEYDSRDNVFTPNKGFRWNTILSTSARWLGSEFAFSSVSSAVFGYIPVSPRLISGYRIEFQYMWGDAPFYLLPYIDMRGIPAMRYQGNTLGLAETEWRWDFHSRLSGVAFVGIGKAVTLDQSWKNSRWHPTGGMGFRYLLARQLKLRAGIDVAHGSEQWAYYIVLGSNWIR